MKNIFKPISFFIICLLLITLTALGAIVDAKDIISYGNKFDSLFANIFNLLINIVLFFVLIFALLKYLWAKKALLIVLYVFLANHILSIFISAFASTDPSDSLLAALIVGAVILYVHNSTSLKQAFSPEAHKQILDCSMKDPSTFLSAEEMIKHRTPCELNNWVPTVFDRYCESNEAKAYLRLKKGLCKQFLEEVWPLSLLTKQLYGDSDQVICEPVLGNQKYDALIEDRRGDAPIKIKVEFTIAIDGYDDHLRMKVLNDKGSANAYGDISVSGTKHTGHNIDIDRSGRDRDELTSNAAHIITEALRRKANRPYGLNHWLCVKFDDRIWVHNKNDADQIRASVSSATRALNLDFAKVFIVGCSGDLLWELT